MEFSSLYKKLLEDFRAPIDTKRSLKVRPKGKYGTINPQLNEPHSTKSISGFKGVVMSPWPLVVKVGLSNFLSI